MVPEVVRMVAMRGHGGPEVLELVERPRPEPGPGEVRVRVAASGVNRADLSQRRGHYPAPPGWPEDVPGLEYAGVVDATGPGVDAFRPGDRVMGIVGGGGYAEALIVPAAEILRVPKRLDLVAAGAIPEVFLTAWDALVLQAGLASGETLLVHAAGSGVGTAAIQIGRALGARVLGTSRTPDKLERASGLGLERGFAGGADADWAAAVLEATGGRGADVILDLVGGSYLAGNQRAIAARGRWIVVGVPGGTRAELDLRALMAKRASVTGTVLRARPAGEKAALARAATEGLLPLFADGALEPVVDATFPPERVAEAHERMEAGETFGKLLIVWGDEAAWGSASPGSGSST